MPRRKEPSLNEELEAIFGAFPDLRPAGARRVDRALKATVRQPSNGKCRSPYCCATAPSDDGLATQGGWRTHGKALGGTVQGDGRKIQVGAG